MRRAIVVGLSAGFLLGLLLWLANGSGQAPAPRRPLPENPADVKRMMEN